MSFPTKPAVVDVGDSSLLQPSTVTLLAWVRAGSTPPTVKTIASQGAASSCAHASYALYTGGSLDASGLRFYIWNGTQSFVSPPADNAMWDGAWHLAAGTYDGANVRLYVDGQQVGSGMPATGPITYGLDQSNSFTIGNYAGASDCTEDTNFSGDVDETRVYSRALSATEIARLAAASGPDPPDLVADGSGPPPPPPPPPPNQPAAPQNVTLPTTSALAFAGGLTGSYYCDPGTWRNLPSPPGFTYRWVALEGGNPVPVATTQQFTPPPAVYGFPITCEVRVQGPFGPVVATSTSQIYSSAGANALPPAYGDVRIRGIDVFQVVQPNAGATQFGWPSGRFGVTCGGGTPTAYFQTVASFFCTVAGNNPQQAMQQANYAGVTLDADKRTTAIVYTNVFNVPAGDPKLTFNVELSGTLNGQSLGDPLVVPATPLKSSIAPFVNANERDDRALGLQFLLPAAWNAPGTLQLTARVRFPDGGFGPNFGVHQCNDPTQPPGGDPTFGFFALPNCDTDDTYTLDKIPVKRFPAPFFASVRLLKKGQTPFTRSPDEVMAAAKRFYPGGANMTFGSYQADLDIDDASKVTVDTSKVNSDGTNNCSGAAAVGTTSGNQATRTCRWQAIQPIIQDWITKNPARPDICGLYCASIRMYDGVLAVSDFSSGSTIGGVANAPEPGWQFPSVPNPSDISLVSSTGPSTTANTGALVVNTTVHPVQGSAHELGHWLTLPHSGSGTGPCKNSLLNEPWPPDDSGRLQGVRFNPTRGFRATPAVDGDPSDRVIYDFMTYCANFADRRPTVQQVRLGYSPVSFPGDSWLSARNWNRVAAALDAFGARLAAPNRRVRRDGPVRAAANRGLAFAVGVAGPDSGAIARVVASDGHDGVAAPDPTSEYKLRSLGAGGGVLLEAGVTLQYSSEGPSTVGSFVGPVAPNAVAVELVHNGRVLARRDRSRSPRVKLIAPVKGTRVRRGGRLQVRWRGSDPDGDALQATVEFSPDAGRVWRTVQMGPSTGRAAVPSSFLAGSRRARVRVTLNDGFADTTAQSSTFVTEGNPPQVRILAPDIDSTVRAGDRSLLSGLAFDDFGKPLKGRALTWYAGRKRLGTGANLKARLPAGKVMLKLVARGSNGLTSATTLRLNVAARRLRVVSASVPQRVSKKAGTVTVTLRTSDRSILTAGGRRFSVRTKATKLKISLPKKPAVGVLKVPFKLSATDRSVKGTISGALWVVRT